MKRKEKWEKYAREVITSSSSKRATFALTVQHTLNVLGGRRDGILLDIGCGFGEIDILIAKKTNMKIIGCDISRECIVRAKENIKQSGMEPRIAVEEGDVYRLPYPDNYFDFVVSFGYASAATYKGVQGEVARVLKPHGFLVCDFINFLNAYKIGHLVSRWRKFAKEEGKHYNTVTMMGIQEYFLRYNLRFISQRLFATYPPLNFVSPKYLLWFENSIGRVCNKFLARVRLVCFQKI